MASEEFLNNLQIGTFQFGLTVSVLMKVGVRRKRVCERSSHHLALHHQKVNGVYGSSTCTALPDQGCFVTEKKKKRKRHLDS